MIILLKEMSELKHKILINSGAVIEDDIFITKPGICIISESKLSNATGLFDNTEDDYIQLGGLGAKICYMSEKSSEELCEDMSKYGHYSIYNGIYVTFLIAGTSIESMLELLAHRESTSSRQTTSKTNSQNMPYYRIQGTREQMDLQKEFILEHLKIRKLYEERFRETKQIPEFFNMLDVSCKSACFEYTMSLKDFRKTISSRIPKFGNETEVRYIFMNILELLYQKYPKCFTDIYIDAFVKYSSEFPEFFKNIKQKSLYLCLMGPPGTGKSTIGAKLSKLLNIPHISTGNLCRKIMNSENNEQSETLKSYINSGLLVPPSIIHSIYEERIKDDDCKNGFILDGYPYKENIDYILENNIKMPIFDVIVLNCDKISVKLFEEMDKHTAVELYSILQKYKYTLHISDENLLLVSSIIKEKYKYDKVFVLNPSISDLLENKIYKLYVNNELYLVPLWHHELYFDCKDGSEIIVLCQPRLNKDDDIFIDELNNVHFNIIFDLREQLCEYKYNLWNKMPEITININKKTLKIPIEKLYIKKEQKYIFKNEGISKINVNDIYDISCKSDIICHIKLDHYDYD